MKKKKNDAAASFGRGRPRKIDKQDWGQITVFLRLDTIDKIRNAGGKQFGKYLQTHLDRFPPPSAEEYKAWKDKKPLNLVIKGRRIPTIISAGSARRVRRAPKPKSVEQRVFERAYAEANGE